MTLDDDTCYRALLARDPRFDGLFFVGVATTGIYCRPVCPARSPRRDRCLFFERAAEAERAGFRACFRCRPELAPGAAPVDSLPRLAAAALARLEAGFLNDGSVGGLARELGVSSRHLHRTLVQTVGLSPVELAQSRRLGLAKQLLQDTRLPLTEVAFASGFSSVRRFNALVKERLGRPPSALRRAHAGSTADGLVLRLEYRPPLDWQALLDFLAPRAIPGVEAVAGDAYLRTVVAGEHSGWARVSPVPRGSALRVELSRTLVPVLMTVVARLRALFDLDAHPARIDAQLAADARLRALVRARPGIRVPGAFDGFETALRAVVGQQVSVRGATTLSGRIARRFGAPVSTPFPELTHTTPSAAALARATTSELAALGFPRRRAAAIGELARAVASGALRLSRYTPVEDVVPRLTAIDGIGEWTAAYVTMRAIGWPDAFPASDLVLGRLLGDGSARRAAAAAEPWRPWRAYGAMRLWLQGLRADEETHHVP